MNFLKGPSIVSDASHMVIDHVEFGPDEMPMQMRMSLVREHGNHTLSYSAAAQTGLRHFGNHLGFIAFQSKFGQVFALADPVTDPANVEPLVSSFLRRFPNAAFVQISESMAERLPPGRFWVNEMGVDTRLELEHYDFSGKEKERFRYAANWLIRRGYSITELPFNDEVIVKAKALAERWRQTRSVKVETAFLNRPIEYCDQPDMRRFFLLNPDGEIAAYVFFDPLYKNGQITGYVTSFKRRDIDCPSMAELGICKVAIEQFRTEGKEIVKLGLSPLAQIDDHRFRHNWIMKCSFRYLYGAGWVNRYFYNVKGHAEFKSRFRGETEKTYFASQTYVNDFKLFALMRLSKIL